MSTDQHSPRTGITRRGMLAAGGAAIIGAAGGYALGTRQDAQQPPEPGVAAAAAAPAAAVPPTPRLLPFHGANQSGIETPPAHFQTFIGLDLLEPTRDHAEAALRLITDDAARLTQGQPALGDTQPELALNADLLTVTVGLGRSLFARTGLTPPGQLVRIPAFPTDRLEERWGETDLLLQVGANDPLALAHAIRMLSKDLSTLTRVRWTQPGFRSNAPADMGVAAHRNLMGQVEATNFPAAGSPQFSSVVWIDEGPDWAVGGTVLVLRRIRMLMDTWDRLDRPVQETVIGRSLTDGRLLTGPDTSANPLEAVDANGLPVIPADAHVRVARASTLEGVLMRRPYNYDNGIHDGTNDMGLLFAAYMRDPRTSFIPTQRRLSKDDAFQRWITTIGSATYVLPRGAAEGEMLAEGLFT